MDFKIVGQPVPVDHVGHMANFKANNFTNEKVALKGSTFPIIYIEPTV